MRLRYLATAAAASALLAGAAYAQDASTPAPADQGATAAPADPTAAATDPAAAGTTAPAADAGASAAPAAPPADASAPPADPSASAAATSGVPTASVQVATTTNGPIPDTAENRAKYGQPMSRAGKRSAAKGD